MTTLGIYIERCIASRLTSLMMTANLASMSCKVCSELQANVEAAARELSRAVNDAKVAIQPIAGIAAGNRIEDAQRVLRLADENLGAHQAVCGERSKSAASV